MPGSDSYQTAFPIFAPAGLGRNEPSVMLAGRLLVPPDPQATVIMPLPHGPKLGGQGEEEIAAALNDVHITTLLVNLLTDIEEVLNQATGYYSMNMGLLARRLHAARLRLNEDLEGSGPGFGIFGSGIGAAVAVKVASEQPAAVPVMVCWRGRLSLVQSALPGVEAATLLIAEEREEDSNAAWFDCLQRASARRLQTYREPAGDAESSRLTAEIAALARSWFEQQLIR